jgi:hypothetical protein
MVYIDDADEENGCLLVVPGSQKRGLVEHRNSEGHGAFFSELPGLNRVPVRAVPGKAGSAIFFGPFLMHASGPNRTSRPRHSFTTVYTNPLVDFHREVFSRFFPIERIKELTGHGPFGFCGENYQRRNLWQLAADHVAERSWNWIEITDRTYNDGSFEWLSARKDPSSTYFRFEQFPLSVVQVHAGTLAESLTDARGPFGLIFLDCEHNVNARLALRFLTPAIREGTVVVLDRFHNSVDWEFGAYKAFHDYVVERNLGFDYLGRSFQQVALRLTGGSPAQCPPVSWQPLSAGITYA